MKFTNQSRLSEVLATNKGRIIMEKHLALAKDYPNLAMDSEMTLEQLVHTGRMGMTKEILDKILEGLNKPTEEVAPELLKIKSLDELDNESFGAGSTPFDSEAEIIELKKGTIEHPNGPIITSLDGEWEMVEGGNDSERLASEWEDFIPAKVPGSVHAALVKAGKIPDPTFGVNQKIAKEESYKTWWMKCTFPRPKGTEKEKLIFDGICNKCTIWLNGKRLGSHEGMFGGPEFDIEAYLKEKNTLIVKLDPIPIIVNEKDPSGQNTSWKKTVVFNNVYGWHYSNLPSLGIWRSVRISGQPKVSMLHPFAATINADEGLVDLSIQIKSEQNNCSGVIRGTIQPDNFEGSTYCFEKTIETTKQDMDLHFRMNIPYPKLWWPVDLGDPNLYICKLSFIPDGGGVPDYKEFSFGIRTIKMAPLPDA
jgi:beta-mannosidase